MKRAWLITGGTLGGLGAVLAVTPPQLSSSESALGTGLDIAPVATTTTDAAPVATESAAPAATKSATATKTTAATSSKNNTGNATSGATATQSAAPAATKAAQTQAPAATTGGKAQSGTFAGDPYTMRYGTVQVQITIKNGKITDAVALTAPGGRDQRYTDMAIPVMRQKTLAAQSANITGVSGASYTAYAWYISLQSALSKAGWM